MCKLWDLFHRRCCGVFCLRLFLGLNLLHRILLVCFVFLGLVVRFLVGLGVFVLALWVLRFVGVVVGVCFFVVGFGEC